MKICPKCGIENLDDARYCFFCDFDFYANEGIKPAQSANAPVNPPKTTFKKLKPVRNSNSQTAEIPVQHNPNPQPDTYDEPYYPYSPPPVEPPVDEDFYDGDEAAEQKPSTTPVLIAIIALLICVICILGYMFLIQKKMNENVQNNKNQQNSSASFSVQTIPVTETSTTSALTTSVTSKTTVSATSTSTKTTSNTTSATSSKKTTTTKTTTSTTRKTTAETTATTRKTTAVITSTSKKTTTAVTTKTVSTTTTTTVISAVVTPCNLSGRISANGGVIASFASSYVVDGGSVKKVRSNLGDGWNVTAVNTCNSMGITWYELYDSDDGDYYGWVDSDYIDFSPKKSSVTVTSCYIKGRIVNYGGSVSGYADSYVVDGGNVAVVRGNLGNWNVNAVNTCTSMGITWYELYDADDGDYYGWVDAGYIDFSEPAPASPSVTVTPCSISGRINTYGGTVAGFASSYVVDGGGVAIVRASLGDWNVTAVNTCTSMGITWYELYDSDDGDYYGWVDAGYINF